ncbi:fimbrial protein [Aeromonas veronii]
MKKNVIALTVLMALSATAQADMVPSENTLQIKGTVTVDGCVFEDGNFDGQNLLIDMGEPKSVAWIYANQDTVLKDIGSNDKTTLLCPGGIKNVELSLKPDTGDIDNDFILTNTAQSNAAEGVGFRLKASFGQDLGSEADWVNFTTGNNFSAIPDAEGKIAINFGANFVLTGTVLEASPGDVEANVPFTITYM